MARKQRNRIVRLDGKPIHLVAKRAHLMVCAKGCCCGRTERGFAAVPVDFYKQEYKRRKIRKLVQLTMSGCLGPCPLANVALLFFDGRPIWFQSLNDEPQIRAVFDYIDQMLAADQYLPPPPELAEYVFTYYGWSGGGGQESGGRSQESEVKSPGAAGIVFLSHADTDLLALRTALAGMPQGFPPVRALSLSKVATAEHLAAALAWPGVTPRIVVVRILGGIPSVPGFRVLADAARSRGQHLIVVSGTGCPDPELTAVCTVRPAVVHETTAYLQAGGPDNLGQMLRFLADHIMLTGFGHGPPVEQPQHGIYHPGLPRGATLADWVVLRNPSWPTVGVIFYRSHWMSGNLAFVDAFVRALEARGANALPVYTSSLKEGGSLPGWPAALSFFVADGHPLTPNPSPPEGRGEQGNRPVIDVLVTTVSFALADVCADGPTLAPPGTPVSTFAALGVPVLQAICGSTARWQWEASQRGLNPLDTAMNVALPEFDGRIISVPISFKEPLAGGAGLQPAGENGRLQTCPTDAIQYVPLADRVNRVAGLARRLATLRRKPNREKRVAFVLTNSPGKAARIGNAVGLDAPASLLRVLAAMRDAGYGVGDLPADGDALIHALIDRCSYDETLLTSDQLANAAGQVSEDQYRRWFAELPERQQRQMTEQWGEAPGTAYLHNHQIALAGLEFGNVFVALQPPRGHGMDPNAIYHQPDLPPPHNYYALYRWLRDMWQADAVVHLGKHGTLEWLPGKGVGLSAECYPDSFLDDLPLFYPFILNDPGEGAQAKRRGHAVIIDHLTPPMTTAEAHGELAELMQLVDEFYQVELLDPSKMPLVQQQIWDLIQRANLADDLKYLMQKGEDGHTHEWDDAVTAEGTPVTLAQMRGREVSHLIQELDGYLCELAGAQIRDGLHILGQAPEGEQLIDLLHALTRIPNLDVPSLRAAVAEMFGLDLDALLAERGRRLDVVPPPLAQLADRPLATQADILETIDELCRHLVALVTRSGFQRELIDNLITETFATAWPDGLQFRSADKVAAVLRFICDRLVPALRQTTDEITHLLAGLEGRYVPAGPSGAPTRGMAHVLPTGRNFYAVDPRALPSAAAWQVGQELAREVLDRFRAETGAYPETVGISAWGTSAMRTHGDDVAEVLALLGVRPVWQKENRRVVGVEVVPLASLGRPRIDVVVRISGFFRDAFPHLIKLLDDAVHAVALADEPPAQNYVRKHYLADLAANDADRLAAPATVDVAALYRIFGAKPGSYGAGLLPLIDERNWRDDADFAETYVNWGGYAYAADIEGDKGSVVGVDARDAFRRRLSAVQVALHNQDNREHDIFDSDDYFQFHGGMIATIRALTGRQPRHYFGDTHDPARPAVRDLKQEALRVFRTRVTNPKWLESITRHGYKGGLELAATVDYLFGYDATAGVAEDWMYEQVAQAYALDPAMREFFGRSNPWALHAVAERLLEAAQRGLWAEPTAETLARLQDTLLHSEEMLETRGEHVAR
jgi:cobaltochelatase CobN